MKLKPRNAPEDATFGLFCSDSGSNLRMVNRALKKYGLRIRKEGRPDDDQEWVWAEPITPKIEKSQIVHMKGGDPDVTAKVFLVPYGYEIDFFDAKGNPGGFECRDFGGSYPIEDMASTVIASMVNTMKNLEADHIRSTKLVKLNEEQFEVYKERRKVIRKAIFAGFASLIPDEKGFVTLKDLCGFIQSYMRTNKQAKPTGTEIADEIKHLTVLNILDYGTLEGGKESLCII